MTFTLRALICGAMLCLAACAAEERFAVAAPKETKRIPIVFSSVEVRDVSLPSYAASEEIFMQRPDGTLTSAGNVLWADAPERSIALELSRNLALISGGRVASEPWPFEEPPIARLEVRFSELLATTSGSFRASGQYFVAVTDGRPERSGLFDLSVPFNAEAGLMTLAQARGRVILELATHVARKGLR
ncbi:MAG: ABC-type transport auxiliary lipoprotein family protein [Pseudomonadota bacterium]